MVSLSFDVRSFSFSRTSWTEAVLDMANLRSPMAVFKNQLTFWVSMSFMLASSQMELSNGPRR